MWIKVCVAGIVVGALSALLVAYGNPGNMGICGVCFTRDIAGALGLHSAKAVQYIRPEIIGIVLGALLSAICSREFAGRGGSAPLVRFLLGALMSVGALVFLGCPMRMLMRMGGGDLNALAGLAGFAAGILAAMPLHTWGYTLGKSEVGSNGHGWIVPIVMVALLALAYVQPIVDIAAGGPVYSSLSGPGSQHAPLWMALGIGLVVGILLQKARFCTVGAVRALFTRNEYAMTAGAVALVAALAAGNAIAGNFHIGFDQQPIAHGDHLWNFLSMALVGLAASLAGGCPVRQLVMAGEGNGGAGIVFLGMLTGAALAHNFKMVSSAAGVTANGQWAVAVGIGICLLIAAAFRSKEG